MRSTRTNRRMLVTATVGVAMLALGAGPALADGHSIVRADLMGSQPAPTSPPIAGINPGNAPWVNGPSSVRVREDGRITVSITGLVIPPPRGTGVNPIAAVVATLVCDGAVRASTDKFPLSAAGDGYTSTMIMGTRHCDDAAVLIQPAANRGVYIASSQGDHDDD